MPKREKNYFISAAAAAIFCAAILIAVYGGIRLITQSKENSPEVKSDKQGLQSDSPANKKIAAYAAAHRLSIDEYPESIKELLRKNPETESFVLEYPLKKDSQSAADLSEYKYCSKVPLLMQWDERWGYSIYGDDVLGITGCSPTCLSMVALYLLHDTAITPAWMAEFSTENGYCVYGNGTSWTLMSSGARELGLEAIELPLDKNRIVTNLQAGHPVICIMGPGDFTDSGHYIVLTGWTGEGFQINDPNSRIRSEKIWRYEDIKDQIRNLWAYSVES